MHQRMITRFYFKIQQEYFPRLTTSASSDYLLISVTTGCFGTRTNDGKIFHLDRFRLPFFSPTDFSLKVREGYFAEKQHADKRFANKHKATLGYVKKLSRRLQHGTPLSSQVLIRRINTGLK